ncbi:hypothetical protein [Falsiroseomonas ponticola]|jgi:hypothetical protein|uniref:hypothetical protein n=1 Tax=Falsiroseomonas ponticola TaxID=2786951 RepID=UPI001932F2F3|nr:hypothetical protein [Roseomonas ponticola]
MPPIRRAAATGLLALWLSPLPAEPGGTTAPTEAALPAGEAGGPAPLEAWRESQRRRPGGAQGEGPDKAG